MKNIKTIFFKELRRFFTEPRMLAALFLPGIIIYIFYSLMGTFMEASFAPSSGKPENYTYQIVATNNYSSKDEVAPLIFDVFDAYLPINESSNKSEYHYINLDQVSEYKEALSNHEYDLLIVFNDNFEDSLKGEISSTKTNISLYYDGSDSISTYLYTVFTSLVDTTYTNFTVNIENGMYVDGNVSPENYTFKNIMSFVVPLVTISLLFSTVISICPEAIAGEKERGTLASLLMTPMKRTELVIGKISALSIVSLSSGLVSFLGLVISLPNLYGGGMTLGSLFSPASFIMLLLLILTTLCVFVTLGLVISAFSKSIKEAGSYLTPIMTILMVASIIPFSIDMSGIGYAFIPLLNIVSSMNLLIRETNLDLLLPYISITAVMNIVLSGVLIFITAKLFNSEKIMFQR